MKQLLPLLVLALFLCLGQTSTETEVDSFGASNGGEGDWFGRSVSASGDVVVVGAHLQSGEGAAYVFDCSGLSCTQESILTASDGATGNRFGVSVAISGSTVIVGSDGDSSAKGAAYIFNCPTLSSCSQQKKLAPSDLADNDRFGYSVSISGIYVAVGAFGQNTGGNADQGATYIFNCSTLTNCLQTDKLVASDGAGGDEFGRSVSVSHVDINLSTLVLIAVGAPGHDTDGESNRGAAYVFYCPLLRYCYQTKKVKASDGAFEDRFGSSVSLSYNILAVGAMWHDSNGNYRQGAAYIFNCKNPSNCPQQSKLVASDGSTIDYFGSSISIHDWFVVVGAPGNEAAYVFDCSSPSSCSETDKLIPSEGDEDWFGYSVSLSKDLAVVGSPWNETAFVYNPPVLSGKCSSSVYGDAIFPPTPLETYAAGDCAPGWSGNPQRQCDSTAMFVPNVQHLCTRLQCPSETAGGVTWPNTDSYVFGNADCNGETITRRCMDGQWANLTETCP